MLDVVKPILVITDDVESTISLAAAFTDHGYTPLAYTFQDLEDELQHGIPSHQPPLAIVIKFSPGSDAGEDESNTEPVDLENPQRLIALVKSQYPDANIPVLAICASTPSYADHGFDSMLIEPCHPAQIVMRTTGLVRLAVMENEITLRLDTLHNDFDIAHVRPEPAKSDPFSILFVGQASPEFMVIINALQRKNVRIVAAFTSFTAFDYLYEQDFDAVVMNGLKSMDSALSVIQTMRKNAKLYHVPALLLANHIHKDDLEKIYATGMNDVLDANAPLPEISARILEQANFHRLHENLKTEFGMVGGEICADSSTNLFNQRFFNAHIARVFKHYDAQNLPISLCLIRVAPLEDNKADASVDSAFQQIGVMIKSLVRLQDITARLEPNLYAIAFPGQTAEELTPVIERIEAILECAAISDPLTGAVIKIKLEVTMTTLNQKPQTANVA